MNNRQGDGYGHHYDPYGQQQPQVIGYDELGQPIYASTQQPPQGQQPGYDPYDPYGTQAGQYYTPQADPYAPTGYQDPYAQPDPYQTYGGYPGYDQGTGQQPPVTDFGTGQQPPVSDFGTGQQPPVADFGTGQQPPVTDFGTGQQPPVADFGTGQQPPVADFGTGQQPPVTDFGTGQQPPVTDFGTGQQPPVYGGQGPSGGGAGRGANGPSATDPGYQTEQFAFVEEPDDNSEDVIDWLKFSESRTERREEAKRRGRNRGIALLVVLALVLAGGVGYLWYAGKLPGVDAPGAKAGPAAGQKRDVIVVHLRPTNDAPSSTLLLVDNASTEKGNTLLLPNSLALASEDGDPTTLGKAVEEDSAAPTRDSLSQLLGAKIKGTWRLDTPYLENLVESVGGVTLTADVTVPGDKKGDRPLVKKGANQDLDGRAAVAYSTHRAEGERQSAQLDRWGQVMQAVFKKFTSDAKSATRTVEALGQVPDPSLDQSQLGASLASLAAHAKSGDYRTQLLPVQGNGTLSERTGDGVVKEVLGGTVKNTDPDAAPTIRVRNSSGDSKADEAAQVALVNGGFSVTDGGRGKGVQARSQVLYSKKDQADRAKEIARTLDLPDGSVKRSTDAGSADVLVVLGRDYEG